MSLNEQLGIKKEVKEIQFDTKINMEENWGDLEYCLNTVKQDGYALYYVKKQTPEICLEAVKQDGWALKYVREQTPEICLEAVKQDGHALYYVENQTPEICLEAVKQDGRALQYVKNQTPEICLAAVKQYGCALAYVKNQTLEIIQAAINNSLTAVDFIDISILSIKDWDVKWFRYLTNVELRRAFIKERGREVFSQLGCVTVDENDEYVLVKFKYTENQRGFQKALIFRCPSSNDVYFQEVKPTLNTVKGAVRFLNNNIRKEELAYES